MDRPVYKENRQRFWMVYVEGGRSPSYLHYDSDSARKEAERLAKLEGRDVFLLEAALFVRYSPPIPPPTLVWKNTMK